MIDFLQPSLWESVLGAFRRLVLSGGRSRRLIALVATLLATAFLLEAVRVHEAWQAASHWQMQRDRLSQTLIELERKNRANGIERATFTALDGLRARSALQAAHLARLGNAIGPNVGLVSLRSAAEGIEVEGRARAIDDVAAAIDRLERSEPMRKTTFAMRRDDSGPGYVWFRLGLQQ